MDSASVPQQGLAEGSVDGVAGYDLAGWAWRPGPPDAPLTVEVRGDGKVLATARADRFRGDLLDAGKRGGHCAFRVAIGRLGLRGRGCIVSVWADGAMLGEPVELSPELVAAAERYAARLSPNDDITTNPGDISQVPLSGLPFILRGDAGVEGVIDQFDADGVKGWLLPRPGRPLALSVMHVDEEISRIEANIWRVELAELRQGDGRGGINAPPPPRLLDGFARAIDLRIGGPDGPSALREPVHVRLMPTDKWSPVALQPPTPQKQIDDFNLPSPSRLLRQALNVFSRRPLQLSVVVNFYNMRREAERTLTSLSRSYQRGLDDIDYEVICIDNGSAIPLEPAWIESFGPEFRLFRPQRVHPSPCFAMNEAIRDAKGKIVALMIDGAHVLTPGAIRESLEAFGEHRNAVVGLRQWFFGGDQRWFGTVGYTREQEDIIFAKIDWPNHGYRMFEVSSPMMPTPSPWLASASESNCLMLRADLLERLGGYDERFDIPGGGVGNLDLYVRAVESEGVTPVMLIGEASFHQFHGGTTTNIEESEKDSEVRRYLNAFSHERGEKLRHLHSSRIRYRGHLPTPEASVPRQRPDVRAALGMTSRIRPTSEFLYFDDGAKDYLQGYAVESGVPELTRWFGKPTGVAAGDLINLQEIIGAIRPKRILAVNAQEGLTLFLGALLKLLNIDDAKLVLVGKGAAQDGAEGTYPVRGPICADETLRAVRSAVGDAEDVLVIFRPDDDDLLPIEAMRTYMSFVSPLSYMVVTGTTSGQPWLGYSTRWTRKAILLLTGGDSEFSIDRSFEFHLVSACSWGYLRRTGGRPDWDDTVYDETLDDLDGL